MSYLIQTFVMGDFLTATWVCFLITVNVFAWMLGYAVFIAWVIDKGKHRTEKQTELMLERASDRQKDREVWGC